MRKLFGPAASLFFLLALLSAPGFAADAARGKELINSLGCKGCHKLDDKGGTVGPALEKVGSRLSEAQLRQKLLDPKATNPKSMMPAYKHLPEKDIEAMVEFMEELK